MVEFKYGFNKKLPAGTKTAKAQGYDVEASYKDLSVVCTDIRGTMAEPALTRLKLAAERKIAIPFLRFNKRMAHRRELGGKKGRFPWKAARNVMLILENAIANASAQGIQTPFIVHAAANKQRTLPRTAPKGRRFRNDYETARIEIVLQESPFERSAIAKNSNAGAKELKVKMQADKIAEKLQKAIKQGENEKAKATV
ncbi:MAG: 50S ribosomal protein L22 [Candidatus Micrarchaeia archaeon]|jgi:large subunit ribosomal protein L22